MFRAVSQNFILQLFATFSIFACYFSQLFRFLHKIGCFKSFTVKCAHKCNLQCINATFAENKCNFLALLLQQELALLINKRRFLQRHFENYKGLLVSSFYFINVCEFVDVLHEDNINFCATSGRIFP